ncbi:Protein borderless [Blattella germanica]|nr:Protein borderless [Blattella germanica]
MAHKNEPDCAKLRIRGREGKKQVFFIRQFATLHNGILLEREKQPPWTAYITFSLILLFPRVGMGDAEGELKKNVKRTGSDSPYGRGSINLTNIRESDSGWYECSVFFPNRTPSTRPNGTWFHLSVEGGTLLTIPPINQTTRAGNAVHFDCVSKDQDATTTWYKDGDPLSSIADLQNRFFMDNGSLTIDPTDVSDPGEYTCVVRNVQGEEQTASAYLNVEYKAKVVKALSEVYLPYGRPGILDCHFLSNPPLTNIRWEKDGFLFDPYNVPGVFYGKNGSLYFTKVDETHSGKYTCTPGNRLGTEGPSPPINVIVQRPPMFTIVPHNLYLRKPGDTLEMPCDAVDGNDNHKPTIILCSHRSTRLSWVSLQKDGSPLPLDRITIHNGNLTIENLKDSDRGLYQCVASNEAATISSDTELMIDNVAPRAPYNLSATSTENSVTLTWVPGFTRPKAEYSVW